MKPKPKRTIKNTLVTLILFFFKKKPCQSLIGGKYSKCSSKLLTNYEMCLPPRNQVASGYIIEPITEVNTKQSKGRHKYSNTPSRRSFQVKRPVLSKLVPGISRFQEGKGIDRGRW